MNKCILIQKWNNDKCQCENKKPIIDCSCEEDYACNRSTYACDCNMDCEIGEYLKGYECIKIFVDDPLLICNDIGDSRKSASINPTDGIDYWLIAVVFLSIAS